MGTLPTELVVGAVRESTLSQKAKLIPAASHNSRRDSELAIC